MNIWVSEVFEFLVKAFQEILDRPWWFPGLNLASVHVIRQLNTSLWLKSWLRESQKKDDIAQYPLNLVLIMWDWLTWGVHVSLPAQACLMEPDRTVLTSLNDWMAAWPWSDWLTDCSDTLPKAGGTLMLLGSILNSCCPLKSHQEDVKCWTGRTCNCPQTSSSTVSHNSF